MNWTLTILSHLNIYESINATVKATFAHSSRNITSIPSPYFSKLYQEDIFHLHASSRTCTIDFHISTVDRKVSIFERHI